MGETIGMLQAFDAITKDRADLYKVTAFKSAQRGNPKPTPLALMVEADALRDAADQIEKLATILGGTA